MSRSNVSMRLSQSATTCTTRMTCPGSGHSAGEFGGCSPPQACNAASHLAASKPDTLIPIDEYLERAHIDQVFPVVNEPQGLESHDRRVSPNNVVAWAGWEFLGGCGTGLDVGTQGWGKGRSSIFRMHRAGVFRMPKLIEESQLKAESPCASEGQNRTWVVGFPAGAE